MELNEKNVVAFAQANPDKALELAEKYPQKAGEIAMVLPEEYKNTLIKLASLTSGGWLLKLVVAKKDIAAKVAMQNPDLVLQIIKQFPESGQADKLEEIVKEFALGWDNVSVSEQKLLIEVLETLLENYPAQGGKILRIIKECNSQLAKEFDVPPIIRATSD